VESTVGPIRRGRYEVTLHYERGYERTECVGIDVRAIGRVAAGRSLTGARVYDPSPLMASDLRALRIGELIDKHRPVEVIEIRDPDSGEPPDRIIVSGPGPRRQGRPPLYGMDHWRKVSVVYRKADATNKKGTRAVARHFGVTQSTAAHWVARCREPEIGLLPPTTRGKTRSYMPPKAGRRGKRGGGKA
jgi:hypothetical protein